MLLTYWLIVSQVHARAFGLSQDLHVSAPYSGWNVLNKNLNGSQGVEHAAGWVGSGLTPPLGFYPHRNAHTALSETVTVCYVCSYVVFWCERQTGLDLWTLYCQSLNRYICIQRTLIRVLSVCQAGSTITEPIDEEQQTPAASNRLTLHANIIELKTN